jgi:hypothetical protein
VFSVLNVEWSGGRSLAFCDLIWFATRTCVRVGHPWDCGLQACAAARLDAAPPFSGQRAAATFRPFPSSSAPPPVSLTAARAVAWRGDARAATPHHDCPSPPLLQLPLWPGRCGLASRCKGLQHGWNLQSTASDRVHWTGPCRVSGLWRGGRGAVDLALLIVRHWSNTTLPTLHARL